MGAHTIGKGGRGGRLESESESKAIMDAIREIVRVLRESSRAAEARVGLSGAQLFVLQRLSEDGSMSLNELSARTLTHQSSVSVVVSRLERGGLVKRVRSPQDARRLEISVTRKGQSLLAKAPDAAQERLIEGVRRMPESERKQLARSLKRLLEAMGVKERIPVMFFEDEPKGARRKKGKQSDE